MNIKIGAKIKELRKQNNITQEKLAESLGVTGQAVSRWESESGYPDIEYIVQIAKYFNVTTDFLFDHNANTSDANQAIEKRMLEVAKKLEKQGLQLETIANITGLPMKKIMYTPEHMMPLLRVEQICFQFGFGLIPLFEPDKCGDLLLQISKIKRDIAIGWGVIIPQIRVQDHTELGRNEYAILIKGVEAARGTVAPDDDEDVSNKICSHLYAVIARHLHEIISRQDVHILIEHLRESQPVLVDELIPGLMTVGNVQKVLAKLLKEGVPIVDLASILEVLADYAPVTRDTNMLTDYVRAGLRRVISYKFFPDAAEVYKVITLDPELEKLLTANIKNTEIGSFVNLDQTIVQKIFDSLKTELEKLKEIGATPIILTSPFVRWYFNQLVEDVEADLVVLSYGEISHTAQIMSLGMVGVGE